MNARMPRCAKVLLALASVAIPTLYWLDSRRPSERMLVCAIEEGDRAEEISAILRRIAAEDRQSLWGTPAMKDFFTALSPDERTSFLTATSLPWDREFWSATEKWTPKRRRRMMLRGVEACQFTGALDERLAEALLSQGSMQEVAERGYASLAEQPDPLQRLAVQPLLEQLQLLSQSAR